MAYAHPLIHARQNKTGETPLQTIVIVCDCLSTKVIIEISTSPVLLPPLITAEPVYASQALRELASPISSSSTVEGGSSPILPPLLAPKLSERALDLLKEPLNNGTRPSTVGWVSPYAETSHNKTQSKDLSEDSRVSRLRIHTPYLRPAPNPSRPQPDPAVASAAILAKRARLPERGLTEDWIRQHTAEGDPDLERLSWLSDNGESDQSSLSSSMSGELSDQFSGDLGIRTPTLRTFLSRKSKVDQHLRQQSTETIRQGDLFEQSPKTAASHEIIGSSSMATVSTMPLIETTQKSTDHVWRAAALPKPTVEAFEISTPLPAASPALPQPRLKAKVPWGKKNITILLPLDDERGERGKAPKPMSPENVSAMLRDWEQLGYDTTGFKLRSPYFDGIDEGQGQSRCIWPDAEMVYEEREIGNFRVSIPDRSHWDAYVQELKEAKLRALGVSFGEEAHHPSQSPAMSNKSRQTSVQYPPLPFSPPFPTSSASSSHAIQRQNPFSPIMIAGAGPSTSQSSMVGSVASPASMQAHVFGKFDPRQSISFSSGEHPLGSPIQIPQQQSPLVWSPSQMLYQSGLARGGSPLIQNLGEALSSGSPFQQESYFSQNEITAQMLQRQQHVQHQILQQISVPGQSPRLQDLGEQKSPSKTPEQMHRRNDSESLQREIDDAEYHLEEQFERQLEHDDYSPHSEQEEPPTDIPDATGELVLHHPQPHSRGHSLSQRLLGDGEDTRSPELGHFVQSSKEDLLEIELQPSSSGTPALEREVPEVSLRSYSNASNPWLDNEPVPHVDRSASKHFSHVPKASVSKLNVQAPEFKFDPSNSFKTGHFSFNAGNFQPALNANTSFMPPSLGSNFSSFTSTGSIPQHRFSGKINAAAPVFTPGQSDFSFSSSGPAFRPLAPSFTPYHSYVSDSVGSGLSGNDESSASRTSIFGNIDMSLTKAMKPWKKSNAVPIVRPDSSVRDLRASEDETVEGADGRINQGEGRVKRVRGAAQDGDSVPLFAEPSLPLQETSREQSPPKEATATIDAQADKENSIPLEQSGDRGIEPSPVVKRYPRQLSVNILENSPDSEGKMWSPFEHQQQSNVEDFSVAAAFPVERPRTSSLQGSKGTEEAAEVQSIATSVEPSSAIAPKKHKKNALSALAKPFEFGSSWFNRVSPPKPAIPAVLPKAGLSSSIFASSDYRQSPGVSLDNLEKLSFQSAVPQPQSPPQYKEDVEEPTSREPTLEEIDDVMRRLNEADRGVNREPNTPRWHQPSPIRKIQIPEMDDSSPLRLQPQHLLRSGGPSPSPRLFQSLHVEQLDEQILPAVQDDPFVERHSPEEFAVISPLHRLSGPYNAQPSDWDDVLTESEVGKFHARTQFFDIHVNDLVGGILAEKLNPLEKTLEAIQRSLTSGSSSSRRARRSVSAEAVDSDADDEDDEPNMSQRASTPRKDRKLDKMRAIFTEALATHQSTEIASKHIGSEPDATAIMQILEEMREQFGQSMRLDLRGEDLRKIVEEAVESRMPATPKLDEAFSIKIRDLEGKLDDMARRLAQADEKTEQQVKDRRSAEDRLAEVQRLFKISSEEEDRLRGAAEEREVKLRTLEDSRSKSTVRATLLEATAEHTRKSHSDLAGRMAIVENDLRQAHQQAQHYQIEAERALEAAKRHNEDAELANDTNVGLQRTVEVLRLQIEESLRVRESMRGKLGSLQDDMARAAREISQENAKRAKKEQELIARQEVLDARLQAEARTRERLEREIQRLESGEREGMRAVSDSKKLEALVVGLRAELHEAQKSVMKYQREFEEARESGLSEVQRTRNYMQTEIDSASNQVNIVRQELEDQIAQLRAELDQAKLDEDTAKARHEMLLEEAIDTKRKDLQQLAKKHENEIDDMQAQHDRHMGNTLEDAQRSEQHLLERLGLSSAKTEHLQERVTHLEEKLEIAKTAALAAAQAARSPRKSISRDAELPEKISPQALRESIMVLQEQLQDREQTIESLEQKLSTVDLDAPAKISKRDDEIIWLRELLAVRISDLQDIITTIGEEQFHPEKLKDAAIRLKANLQMEEQERERAMNGGSAINLPNIAASIRDVTTPRVAQVVGPMAAAWGNWRKTREGLGNFSEIMSSTPLKTSPGAQSFLSGLLTPPASTLRQTPPLQPTAFNSTGRRISSEQVINGPRGTPRKGKATIRPGQPSTPPMMRKSSYDQDAHAETFSDAGFYDDDESTMDDSMINIGRQL